ncbi:hypothetical protein BMF94_0538 [Rhodotorula taiwanensis]|uniref:Pentacotripeptide-repeat region of PRORP domain-containing protein n=1 Tax=Rhodotorula taiwanensis TaxID=741276 RepID=A0A2S5BHV0_9BASI|nr:hypothetical protein BMF94_0538 [Rhodotorula taiwanensis]
MRRCFAASLARGRSAPPAAPPIASYTPLDVLAPAFGRTAAQVGSLRLYASSPPPASKAAPASRNAQRAARVDQPVTKRSPAKPRKRKSPRSVAIGETPSAVNLLSQIRGAAPSAGPSVPGASAPHGDAAIKAHNKAVHSLLRGVSGPELSFQDAFVDGWLPLRRTGQAGRVKARDLEQALLSTVTLGAVEVAARYAPEIDELALYLAGETDTPALANWAWATLQQDAAGSGRVVELWHRIRRGDHLTLRTANDGPCSAHRSLATEGSPAKARRKPPSLYAAYIAAKAMVLQMTHAPGSRWFASALPDLLDSSAPPLAPLLTRPDLAERLDILARGSSRDAETAKDPDFLLSVVRQVSLAQTYYALPDRPGEGLYRDVSSLFMRGQWSKIDELWQDVRTAVDHPDLSWLDCSAWSRSARRSPLDQDGEDASAQLESLDSGMASPISPQPPTEPHTDRAATRVATPFPTAVFTQQLVARFFSGFVQAQKTDSANAIWAWLSGREPPLPPGVACWTGLLRGYSARANVASVEAVFADMQRTPGLEPDYFAWMERVEAFFEAKQPDEAMRVAREMMRDRYVLRDLERAGAASAFPLRMWNRLQSGLLTNGRVKEAEALLTEMEQAGVAPSITTVNAFLKYHARGSKPDLAGISRVLQLVADKGLAADVYTFTMLLQALLAVGHRDASAKTIEIMQATGIMPTATTYGALIHSLASTGEAEHLRAATHLLDEMESKRMQTNEIVYTSLIQGFLRAGEAAVVDDLDAATGLPQGITAALTLKDRMERRGIAVPRAAYNVLLSASLAQRTEAGKVLAFRLFREMKQAKAMLARGNQEKGAEANSVTVADTWYILLDGFSKMRDDASAAAMVREMRESGFTPRSKALLRLVHRVQKGWDE